MTRTASQTARMESRPPAHSPPAPTPSDVSGAVAEDLALYREKFRLRLPESLDELHGPAQGAWSCHCTWPGRR